MQSLDETILFKLDDLNKRTVRETLEIVYAALEEKGYDPLVYRMFCLQSHYRKTLLFSWENLDNATKTFDKLINKIAALNPENGELDQGVFDQFHQKFSDALGNDLNTSLALTCVYDILKFNTSDKTKLAVIDDFDTVLGLDLLKKAEIKRQANKAAAKATAGAAEYQVISEDNAVDAEIEEKLKNRYAAKKAKDFATADQIRDELKAMGVEITDIPNGVKWKKI